MNAELVASVDKLRKEGRTVAEACKELGTFPSSYYEWKSKPSSRSSRKSAPSKLSPRLETIPIVEAEKIIAVIGTPGEIASLLRGLK